MGDQAEGSLNDRSRPVIVFLATGAFLGYSPIAPGTVGTLGALPAAFVMHRISERSIFLAAGVLILAVAMACWVAGRAERVFRQHDSSRIVIDEVVGYLAAVFYLPLSPLLLLVAFLLFRLFDVWKPFPASWLDRHLSGGTGVVLDDVAAGIYTNLALRLLLAVGLL